MGMSNLFDTYSPAANRPLCVCLDSHPQMALDAIGKARMIHSLTDNSHFMVRILRCESCGQLFLKIFYELIDWSGGDDSQARMFVPISESEAKHLIDAGQEVNDQFLLDMNINRRFLSQILPRGGEERVQWGSGPLVILPHD